MRKDALIALTDQVADLSLSVGQFLREERRQFDANRVDQKGFNNLVSYVDKAAEKRFVSKLQDLLPGAGIIAEEGTEKRANNGLHWVIDPLDGTTNYIHNIPVYCTSVALIEEGRPILGVVFDPERDEMFSGSQQNGAFLNGQPVAVSPSTGLQQMLFATGFPYEDEGWLAGNLSMIGQLTKTSRGIRRLGSAALDMCYVACGRLDGFYELGLNAWDVAGATCIIREAGGTVDDFKGTGNPLFDKSIIAASPAGFEALEKAARKHFLN